MSENNTDYLKALDLLQAAVDRHVCPESPITEHHQFLKEVVSKINAGENTTNLLSLRDKLEKSEVIRDYFAFVDKDFWYDHDWILLPKMTGHFEKDGAQVWGAFYDIHFWIPVPYVHQEAAIRSATVSQVHTYPVKVGNVSVEVDLPGDVVLVMDTDDVDIPSVTLMTDSKKFDSKCLWMRQVFFAWPFSNNMF